MKRNSKLIAGFFLVGLVVIFSVINTEKVNVNFGFAEIASPLILIILGSTILGALIVFVTWFSSFWVQRKEVKKLKKQVSDFEAHLAEKIEQGMEEVQQANEAALQAKQLRIDELEKEFSELSGEFILDEPVMSDE